MKQKNQLEVQSNLEVLGTRGFILKYRTFKL